MPDIVAVIDALHARWRVAQAIQLAASKAGSDHSRQKEASDDALVSLGIALIKHWIPIRDRLWEAERERDEWKLASSKNGEAMTGYQSRAIVAEARNAELERKARAFDAIDAERVHGIREQNGDWKVYRTVADFKADRNAIVHQDLLTAIESTLKENDQ